ncbi:hypothetical protein HU200_059219 [Digitaria exilis]|uniref:Uncharacterized protein n=1 Tax=Digitaria exilis TaxID=1010633 RepID=A0A835E2Z3_9POAL|nr:hypothetical protein HU200_059219 [Digitaria exilis]
MDRRLRSPARRPAAPRADERQLGSPHRFLRPGALARLRDSKVLARSLRCAARALIPPPSSSSPSASPTRPSPAPAAAAGDGGVPCFLGSAARGSLRYPLRKKLAAARGVVFLPYPSEAVEPFVDAFAAAAAAAAPSSDLLAAH